MSTADLPHSQALLEHAAFVRAVARSLVRDDAAADDLAQDTWVRAATARAPERLGELKQWLAKITRNRAAELGRSGARRSTRERAVARAEALESVEETVARLDAQRDVVAKILALDEPYRSVVVLRYYHELSSEEIAQRLGSKPATVRTQLTRAHELLRGKLDKQYGSRAAWAGLLLPDARASASAALGVGFIVAAVVGAALLYFAWPKSDGAKNAAAPAVARSESVATDGLEVVSPTTPSAQREAAPLAQLEAPDDELLCEPAELFDRTRFGDYEKATFSFLHGLRDDALGVVNNNWELLFQSNEFVSVTVAEDAALICDLGARSLESLTSAPLAELEALVEAASRAARSTDTRSGEGERSLAQLGHTYFVWSAGGDSDLASAFEVVQLERDSHCLLEWYSTADGRSAKGSLRDGSRERSLMETLVALRRAAQRPNTLAAPRAVLQLRSGAIGGNPVRITLRGDRSYVDELTASPLDVLRAVDSREPQLAHCAGGFVPADTRWAVTSARFRGQASGDSNGRGALRVVIGGETLLEREGVVEWLEETWSGRIEIAPGTEGATYIEVSNSSALELVLEGEFVRSTPVALPRRAFVPDVGPRTTRSVLGPRLIVTPAAPLERFDVKAERRPRVAGRAPRFELEYAQGELRTRAWRGDEIALADLGEFTPAELLRAVDAGQSFSELRSRVRSALGGPFPPSGMRSPAAALIAGHAYFVVELGDVEQSTPTLLFARAVDAGVRCELDWFELHSELGATSSLPSSADAAAWARAARYLENEARAALALAEPRAEFQFRAMSANGSSVDLAGRMENHLSEISRTPLDLSAALRPGEFPSVHRLAGHVPQGSCFIVTRIELSAAASENAAAPSVTIHWKGAPVLHSEVSGARVDNWSGEFVVRPGEEQHFVVEARNVATAHVIVTGRFEPLRAR
ncbi:MAG: sigma-70 family RNA polymerase sigma factor [Planctomycetes bacterium]|nr:sigma-70 family RNA polymerase sigma factor [Planctomycetota bacterium]